MAMLNYQRVTVNVKIVGEASLDALNIMVEGRILNLPYNPPLFRHWSTNDAAFTVPKWVWLRIRCLLPHHSVLAPNPKNPIHGWYPPIFVSKNHVIPFSIWVIMSYLYHYLSHYFSLSLGHDPFYTKSCWSNWQTHRSTRPRSWDTRNHTWHRSGGAM